MATFKATIFKDRQREDKTWNVFIRFTHERRVNGFSQLASILLSV